MHLFATLPGLVVVLWVLMDSCLGEPICPCQSQPSNCPCQSQPSNCPCQSQPCNCPCQSRPSNCPCGPQPLIPSSDSSVNPPCDNCCDNCKNVQTLNVTIVNSVPVSPFYNPITTAMQGDKQIDSICITYIPIDGKYFLQFTVTVYFDGTYSVAVLIVVDLKTTGMFRSEGTYTDDSGESSFVTNAYAFGSVLCPNCTAQPLTAIYSCPQFADCSLPRETSDFVYVLSDQPIVDGDCLDQIQTVIEEAGFDTSNLVRPPRLFEPKCVTQFNGAPCINADRVPDCSKLAYPPA